MHCTEHGWKHATKYLHQFTPRPHKKRASKAKEWCAASLSFNHGLTISRRVTSPAPTCQAHLRAPFLMVAFVITFLALADFLSSFSENSSLGMYLSCNVTTCTAQAMAQLQHAAWRYDHSHKYDHMWRCYIPREGGVVSQTWCLHSQGPNTWLHLAHSYQHCTGQDHLSP